MIERLGVGQNGCFSGFDLHPLDGHSDIDDVSLPPLGHRHGDDVMLPSEVVTYHCSDAIWRNWDILVQLLCGFKMNRIDREEPFPKHRPARSNVSRSVFGGRATFCEKSDDGAS